MGANLATDNAGRTVQAVAIPAAGVTATLALSTSSAATAALSAGVYRVVSDVACFLCSEGTPTATAADMPFVADREEYFNVIEGLKIAGIVASGTGTLTFTAMG